jgi:hypothetical protein
VAAPIPLEAPVITTTAPFSRMSKAYCGVGLESPP